MHNEQTSPNPTVQKEDQASQVVAQHLEVDVAIGTEPIGKKQPWRDIVQKFAQPDTFFKQTPEPSSDGKIRLLQELDAKSR
ncbi:hypothetical protein ANO14919_089830 [Xylariales sp. No.14919]|nr:hypothetical protein ANO14919_089830 [Xylariales sp. No.14919]